MNKLKPCPFCGSSLLKIYDNGLIYPWVQCVECLANTSSEPTVEEAIKAWNRRVDSEVEE
jgi:Lar family restriction alleviation protein